MAKNGFQTKKLEIAQTKVCVVENADNQATFRADFKWYDAKKTNNVLEKKEFRKLAKAQYDFTESETNRLMKKFDTCIRKWRNRPRGICCASGIIGLAR
jgi:hypothetical protein